MKSDKEDGTMGFGHADDSFDSEKATRYSANTIREAIDEEILGMLGVKGGMSLEEALKKLVELRAKRPNLTFVLDNDCFHLEEGEPSEESDAWYLGRKVDGIELPDVGPEELAIAALQALGFKAKRV